MHESTPPINAPENTSPLAGFVRCFSGSSADNLGSLVADPYGVDFSGGTDPWKTVKEGGRLVALGRVASDLLVLPLFTTAAATAEFQLWGLDAASRPGKTIGGGDAQENTGLAYDFGLDTDAGVLTGAASARTVSLLFDFNGRPYRPSSGGTTYYVGPMIGLDWLGFRWVMPTVKTISAGSLVLLVKPW